MIRPSTSEETETLVEMAARTGVFKPLEIDTLRELLDDYHENGGEGHAAVTVEDGGRPVAFAYFAPTPMTEATWHLYWIVVERLIQTRGIGTRLLQDVEEAVRRAGGRVLLIETSSLPVYHPTRQFYSKLGYDHEATVRDFYAPGDHQVIFRKSL